MSPYTAIAVTNAAVAFATMGLVLGLFWLGAGGWSFWGMLLIFGFVHGKERSQ